MRKGEGAGAMNQVRRRREEKKKAAEGEAASPFWDPIAPVGVPHLVSRSGSTCRVEEFERSEGLGGWHTWAA